METSLCYEKFFFVFRFVGEEPHKIWNAIHNENCFGKEECLEQRIFHRIISGFHAEVSAHICANYPLFEPENEYDLPPLGPSLEAFQFKLGHNENWKNNLRFTFVFLLRAMNKAKNILLTQDYEEENTAKIMDQILTESVISQCCRENSFDELELFQEQNTLNLMYEMREKFRNISRILDCVGCQKCRLHGKLQVLGIGTAFKILFTDPSIVPDLDRNEIVALVVTMGKFSEAIDIMDYFENMQEKKNENAGKNFLLIFYTFLFMACTIMFLLCKSI